VLVDNGFASQEAIEKLEAQNPGLQILAAMGFRRFSMRGDEKAGLEWTLVCLAYNLKRLHILGATPKPA
jgi:hypothetical protein